MADAVRYTGGWLYDQVSAGWEVVVVVPKHSDLRPLEILGATTAVDLESALVSSPHGPMPDTVAVAAELFDADDRIRAGVLDVLTQHPSTLTLFGETVPAELESRIGARQHQLSRAARVFKSHALAALDEPASRVGLVETFRSGGIDGAGIRGSLVSMS